MSCLLAYQPHVTNHYYTHSKPFYTFEYRFKCALKPQYTYLNHLKHENPSILNFSESVEIDIPRVSIRDQDRLVASVSSPSLLNAADGTGGASSSLPNLVVSLPTVATNEVVEFSLPTVASLLPVVSLPTVAAETLLVVSLPTVATNEVVEFSLPPVASLLLAVSLPTVATEIPAVSLPTVATIATTSGSTGNSSNEGPRALTVSDSLIDNCDVEIRIDHPVDDDNRRASPNSIGLDSSSSSDSGSSESSQSNDKSRKRSRSPSV